MITRRLFSYTLAASAAAVGAQVALPQDSASQTDATAACMTTSPGRGAMTDRATRQCAVRDRLEALRPRRTFPSVI
jgi:hypothetical protein